MQFKQLVLWIVHTRALDGISSRVGLHGGSIRISNDCFSWDQNQPQHLIHFIIAALEERLALVFLNHHHPDCVSGGLPQFRDRHDPAMKSKQTHSLVARLRRLLVSLLLLQILFLLF